MLKSGKYPIQSEEQGVSFVIGRKRFGIFQTHWMNCLDPIQCLHEIRENGKIHPLKNITGNRFKLGKYGQLEVIIQFNFVEILHAVTCCSPVHRESH